MGEHIKRQKPATKGKKKRKKKKCGVNFILKETFNFEPRDPIKWKRRKAVSTAAHPRRVRQVRGGGERTREDFAKVFVTARGPA